MSYAGSGAGPGVLPWRLPKLKHELTAQHSSSHLPCKEIHDIGSLSGTRPGRTAPRPDRRSADSSRPAPVLASQGRGRLAPRIGPRRWPGRHGLCRCRGGRRGGGSGQRRWFCLYHVIRCSYRHSLCSQVQNGAHRRLQIVRNQDFPGTHRDQNRTRGNLRAHWKSARGLAVHGNQRSTLPVSICDHTRQRPPFNRRTQCHVDGWR